MLIIQISIGKNESDSKSLKQKNALILQYLYAILIINSCICKFEQKHLNLKYFKQHTINHSKHYINKS